MIQDTQIIIRRRDIVAAYHALCRLRQGLTDGGREARVTDRAIEIFAEGYASDKSLWPFLREAAAAGAHLQLLVRIRVLNFYAVSLGLITSIILSYLPFAWADWGAGMLVAAVGWLFSFLSFSRIYAAIYSIDQIDRVRRVLEMISSDSEAVVESA